AITTAHMPSAKIVIATAVISRRYSRMRNGASTRHPPDVPADGSMSYCVLTQRWWPTVPRSVQCFSATRASVHQPRRVWLPRGDGVYLAASVHRARRGCGGG